VNYLRATGRTDAHCRIYENYYRAQGLWACRSTAD
jgi:aconitase A